MSTPRMVEIYNRLNDAVCDMGEATTYNIPAQRILLRILTAQDERVQVLGLETEVPPEELARNRAEIQAGLDELEALRNAAH